MADEMKKNLENEELDLDALEEVSGGWSDKGAPSNSEEAILERTKQTAKELGIPIEQALALEKGKHGEQIFIK
ncbi:MAG: hypothetical protein K5884_10455 [Ruminococcus sp.]|nr:hypothetical protein [Ruminococcus sp.]